MTRVIVRTPEQHAANVARRRELARERREAGLCCCGAHLPDGAEHVQCDDCRENRRAKYNNGHRERRRLGVCVDGCGRSVGGRFARCVEHRKKQRAKDARRRESARSDGKCITCRKNPIWRGGRCRGCWDLRTRPAVSRINATRKRRAEAGQCIECGDDWFSDKFVRCDGCRRAASEKAKATADERIANGLCRQCGKRPPCEDSTSCKACRARRRGRDRSV